MCVNDQVESMWLQPDVVILVMPSAQLYADQNCNSIKQTSSATNLRRQRMMGFYWVYAQYSITITGL